jgi:DNA-binding Xre family transcriptional regulator
MAKKSKHVGSDFDDFLAGQDQLEASTAVATKRVIAWQISEAMKTRSLTKKAMAERMNTSSSQLDRMLDENDTALTLETLSRAASALVVACPSN